MSPEENLAQAIIKAAAEDYRLALKRLRFRPKDHYALELKKDCESFFRSRLFGRLTALDPEYLMKRIQDQEVESRR